MLATAVDYLHLSAIQISAAFPGDSFLTASGESVTGSALTINS